MKAMKKIVSALVVVLSLMAVLVFQASAETVTADALNIRSGPSTDYDRVGTVYQGEQVTILETQTVGSYIWGKIAWNDGFGWIRLDFTDYQPSSQQPEQPEETPEKTPGKWVLEGQTWYYIHDGQKCTGWINDGTGMYYLGSDGAMKTGWLFLEGKWYFFNKSGRMTTGWLYDNNLWYYFNSSGVMQTGWIKTGNNWYYLKSDGAMVTGWLQQGSAWYYLNKSGVMLIGKHMIAGVPHKFDMNGVWQGQTIPFASNSMIAILKLEEGFSAKPYWDYSQWTVGYGTRCPDDKLDEYKANGIPEAEAEFLLQEHLDLFETELEKFVKKTGIKLTQNQLDALLLLSYNCGSSWTYDASGILYNAVVSGATGNELINAFSRWCNAGGVVNKTLLRRRLSEANMYLNGVYDQKPPENYGYVLYDACGGTVRPNVQGYDTQLTAQIIPTPVYSGYQFAGWYTAAEGGTKVTVLDASTKNARLYAHWTTEQEQDPTPGGTLMIVTVTANGVNLRKGPGTNYEVVGTANNGDRYVITEVTQAGGYTWGKFETGWICLEFTNYETILQQQKPSWVLNGGKWYYCIGGVKLTGWVKDGKTWYYMDANGVMQTGWIKDGSTWYYLNASGAMQTGWLKLGSTWYYLNASGAMQTGWLKLGSIWYYLDGNGAMVTGTQVIGGITYRFADSGAWIN